jgi:hypothetical protein
LNLNYIHKPYKDFKGIVSRDLHICFWNQSIDLTLLLSLLCEWSRASVISLYDPTVHANVVSAENFWRWTLSQSWDPAAPYLEFLLLSAALINFLCKTSVGLKTSPTHRVSALHREAKKFDSKMVENVILNENKHASYV